MRDQVGTRGVVTYGCLFSRALVLGRSLISGASQPMQSCLSAILSERMRMLYIPKKVSAVGL